MKQLSATAAHISVGPIPVERGKNFSIVAGNFATGKDQPGDTTEANESEYGKRVLHRWRKFWVLQYRAVTRPGPEQEERQKEAPQEKWTAIFLSSRRCRSLSRVGLALSPMGWAGIRPCALLMEYRQSHDIRAAALIASVRRLLFCDGHFRDSGNSLPQIESPVMGSGRFCPHNSEF